MMKLITKNQIEEIAKMMIVLYDKSITKYQVKQSLQKLLSKHSFVISPNEKEKIANKIWQQIKKELKK